MRKVIIKAVTVFAILALIATADSYRALAVQLPAIAWLVLFTAANFGEIIKRDWRER